MKREQEPKKNLIFIFTDQQRADVCGCYGSKIGLTPNLDILANKGMLFENAFTPQPVCGPARSVLQTGLYATSNGCYRNDIAIDCENHKMLAEHLNEAGYKTGYIGKWHLSRTHLEPITKDMRCGYKDFWLAADLLEFTSNAYGGYLWDENDDKVEFKDKYRVDVLTDYLVDFICDNAHSEKPYFMFISYLEPHHQNTENRFIGPNQYEGAFEDAKVPKDLIELDGTNADWKENIEGYYGCTKSIDDALGRIIETLKNTRQYDDTVLIFTSDHGCHFRTRNDEYKRSCHDASIKIPMVIAGGGIKGEKIDDMVSLIDLPPTILDIAGCKIPNQFQGKSLLKEKKEDFVFVQISESQLARAIRTKGYTYCVSAQEADAWNESKCDIYVESELYDLKSDEYQLNNQIDNSEYSDVKKGLREKLVNKIYEVEGYRPKIIIK